jgi:hypothetical protein
MAAMGNPWATHSINEVILCGNLTGGTLEMPLSLTRSKIIHIPQGSSLCHWLPPSWDKFCRAIARKAPESDESLLQALIR